MHASGRTVAGEIPATYRRTCPLNRQPLQITLITRNSNIPSLFTIDNFWCDIQGSVTAGFTALAQNKGTNQWSVMEMESVAKKQGQGRNEKLPSDSRGQVLGSSQSDPPRIGIWKYMLELGIDPSLVLIAKRYVSFGIVGASGIGVDMAALFVFADPRMLHLNLSLGKALAAEIAIFSNFVWNELWTFRDLAVVDLSWRGRTVRFGKFNLICLAGIALSMVLLYIQTRLFDVNMYVGNLMAIVIVSLWNFGMNQKFGWKKAET